MSKHLIIGSGPAALAAVEKIRKLKPEDEIKVVSMEDGLPYCRTVLPYLLAGKVAENAIWTADARYFDSLKVAFAGGQEVIRVLPEEKRVIYRDGDSDSYDKLLIASGSEPTTPPIKGLDGDSFLGFHTLGDYHRLLEVLDAKPAVVILGAGLVGIQLAVALSRRGHKVAVVEKESHILPLYFDEPVTTYMMELFRSHKVEVLTGEEVTEVRNNGNFTDITCASGKLLHTDLLISCVGVQPRASFLDDSGIRVNRGVVVDTRMRSNLGDIYAAGDVAEVADFFCRQPGVSAIIPSAVAQGKVAGANMAGSQSNYEGCISMNTLNIFGHLACSIGIAMPKNGEGEVLEQEDEKARAFKRLVFRDNKLIGAMFFDVDILPGAVRYLIQNRIEIGRHRQLLVAKPKQTACWLMLEAERNSVNK